MSEAKLPPQGLDTEPLVPIAIEDTLPVFFSSSLDVLTSAADQQTTFVWWNAVRKLSVGRFAADEGEQTDTVAQRNAIDDIILRDLSFKGKTQHRLARDDLKNAEHWLGLLNYDDLAIATRALAGQLAERRLKDCEEQVSTINGLIADDPDLYVLLWLSGAPDSDEQKYKIARLKGMFISSANDEPAPSLVIAGESGQPGLVPEEYHPFGLYVK